MHISKAVLSSSHNDIPIILSRTQKTEYNILNMHFASVLALVGLAAAAPAELSKRATVKGFDISHYQSSVDFNAAYNSGGLRFVYIKATEGTTYKDPKFSSHYTSATNAGFIRGGYHFAHGDTSATSQANYFVQNGGRWSNDGKTLPGMLDLEGDCISVSWIKEFSDRYHALTSRYPVLYSSPSWWKQCTGNSNAFTSTNPLMMACWSSSPCTPQGGWPYYTM